ncbi:NUDIX hydrolase [Aurantibacter sp.]|uniref:NUDIX hydrolase n=1 Tax=Aurantibacter sp. TaxID=2807103 RepID=UPI0035C81384
MNFDEFVTLVSKVKNITLPAEKSHLKMVPPYREDLIKQQAGNIANARKAAVMALFYPNSSNQTYLVLILRKTYKGVHSAQIGFPGGKVELEDKDLEYTALRETFEEVGVPIDYITPLKALTKVYIPPSNFYVSPFLGISKSTPLFVKQDDEVEEILEVKLQDFLDDKNLKTKEVQLKDKSQFNVPAMELNNHLVWGATAMMLSEVKDLLKSVL